MTALASLGSVEWRNPERIPTVRPEDIIAMKLQAGGGLDYEDARALLQVQAQRLDEALPLEACTARRVLDRLVLLRR